MKEFAPFYLAGGSAPVLSTMDRVSGGKEKTWKLPK